MKRTGIAILTLMSLSNTVAKAQDVRAELALARFNDPDSGPYLETYLRLKANSLVWQPTENGLTPEVLISCEVTKGNAVVFQDNYKVKGPAVADKNALVDFIDLQRIPVKNGHLQLSMTIHDLNNPSGKDAKVSQEVLIGPKRLKVYVSDIQLVDTYKKTVAKNMLSKGGFDLVPYTSNFFPKERKEITFYAEVYNTANKIGTEDEFLINMFIENADDGRIAGSLRSFVKRKGAKVVPVLHSFPLADVPSGNYNLILEAIDQKNEKLDRKIFFFQRSNSIDVEYVSAGAALSADGATDLSQTFVNRYNRPEELEEYLRCLHPISSQEDIWYVNTKMNFKDPDMMKKFMYDFWNGRNPDDPEKAWLEYWKEVEKVNATYSTNIYKGYDTDRGRVYLQYGPPNTISPNYFEPDTYPYEIWHYYILDDHMNTPQNNRKFVFANLSPGTKDFVLIHSDAQNEINNRRWNYDLQKRSDSEINLDEENGTEHYGGHAKDFFENPY